MDPGRVRWTVAHARFFAGLLLIVASTTSPGTAASQDATPSVRQRILLSETQARDWLNQATRDAHARQQYEHVLTNDQQLALRQKAPRSFITPFFAPSGTHRLDVTYVPVDDSPNTYEGRAAILDDDGNEQRSFAVVPFHRFALTEAADYLIAYGNELQSVMSHGDLRTWLVFYDGQGNELGRDDGIDLSPIRSVATFEPARFVMAQPTRLVAWDLTNGRRIWELPLQPAGLYAHVVSLVGGTRLGAVVGSPENAHFLVIDADGNLLADFAYEGRSAPDKARCLVSEDGLVVAIGDVVGDELRYHILDARDGEVLREIR